MEYSVQIFGYLAAILVGVVLGALGGGGSILSIPILVYLFGIEPVLASAYSLFIVGTTSLIGAIPKYREHLVNLHTGFVFGIPSILAIFSTRKWVVPSLPEFIIQTESFTLSKRALLLGLFGVLMVLASFSMIRNRKEPAVKHTRFRTFLVIVEGTLIGFLTGLVGAGGGFLIIPALMFLTGLNFKIAVGTSLFIIAINSLVGFLGDVLTHTLNWPFVLSVTALAVGGILAGHALARKRQAVHLRKAFGWLTLAMGLFILIRESGLLT